MRLYVDRPMYSEICKSKGYDGIELFIVDGDRKKGKKIKSFYIAYKPDSEEISAICKTNDYDADIVADTKKSAAKAETDTVKCNCSDPMSGHLGKGEQDAHADCCKRDSIILQHLDELSQTRRNRKDVEFAYNNRTIKDQKPHVTFGYYDEKSNVLYLENLFCDFIKRAKGYDNIEIFVIGNTKETKSNISSYVVSYSPQTNEIVNVSKIKEFHYNRSYDKADRY